VKKELPDNFYDRIKRRLHKRIGREVRTGRRVLDLGCGSCELVRYLAGAYAQDVTGVDISDGSFPPRRRTTSGNRFHCLKRDAGRMRFAADGSADAVVTMWALHEMEKPLEILREARRVLRPGGEIVVIDFPRGSLAQRLWNEHYYRLEEVEALLRNAGFEEVQARLIEQQQVIWSRAYRPRLPHDRSGDRHRQARALQEAGG